MTQDHLFQLLGLGVVVFPTLLMAILGFAALVGRPLKEVVIARQLEENLSKRRILEIYLNVVEWGRNIYGAEAAARFYFGKSAAALDPLESATLAALLPSPRNAKERNIASRRNMILARLASVGYISNDEYQRTRQVPLFRKVEEAAPELPQED